MEEKLTGLLQIDGRGYNCCESTVMLINEKHPLPGFGKDTMKIMSTTGGGVGMSGSACGAVVGIATAIGLAYGIDGTEPQEEYAKKRLENFMLVRGIVNEFREKFGSINCNDITGLDFSVDEELGKRAKQVADLRENLEPGAHPCDPYVTWAAERVLAQLKA
jgi:C_GCAxxG_C_C family probable redox protein